MTSATQPTVSTIDLIASLPQPQMPVESLPQTQMPVESLPQTQMPVESLPPPQLPVASEATSPSQPLSQQEPQKQASIVPANFTSDPSASSSKANHLPECSMHKNRLQQYTQKSGIQLPVYNIVNEGLQHAPRFRANVVVDGITYTSSSTFFHRKEAEQDVAKLALQQISKQIREGGCVPLREVSVVLCKLVLNEFSAKMSLQKPVYSTTQQNGPLPLFVSSLSFNGSTYTGDAGKNKKEAEQLAARAAIESLLGNSDSRMVLSEIIRSKPKPLKDAQDVGNNVSALRVNERNGLEHLPDKGKKTVTVAEAENNEPKVGVIESSVASFPPHHVFGKPNQGCSSEAINLPIIFVPAAEVNVASSSGKRKRKNKKKPNKKSRIVDPLALYAVTPSNQAPPCPVGQ